MINLLEETKEMLLNHGKHYEDIEFVVGLSSSAEEYLRWSSHSNDELVRTTWDEFAAKANKNYDNSFGFTNVLEITMIVIKNF